MLRKTILTYFLVTLFSFATVKRNVSSLKRNYINTKNKIARLEKKISAKNLSYVEIVKRRQVIDLEIYELKKEILQQQNVVKTYRKKLSRAYRSVLVQDIDSESVEDILRRKVLISGINKRKKEVTLINSNLDKMSDQLRSLSKDYNSTRKYEDELLTLLRQLEVSKNDYVEQYVKIKDEYTRAKDLAKSQLRKKKNKIKYTYKRDFLSPIKDYISSEKKNRGITYKTKIVEPVIAAKAGVVVHNGSLANYGNVIMIDHGEEVISVYLGNFTPSVSKGAKVARAESIGQINAAVRKDLYSNLYFDVRKKNKILNTSRLVVKR